MLVELFPRVHRRYTSLAISQWLGHASFTTTHWYATVDLDMKRQALAKARPPPEPLRGRPGGAPTRPCWMA